MSDLFLEPEDVKRLTGYASKRRQIEQLRKMGVAFFINALKEPVVPRSAIDGSPRTEPARRRWESPVDADMRAAASSLLAARKRGRPST